MIFLLLHYDLIYLFVTFLSSGKSLFYFFLYTDFSTYFQARYVFFILKSTWFLSGYHLRQWIQRNWYGNHKTVPVPTFDYILNEILQLYVSFRTVLFSSIYLTLFLSLMVKICVILAKYWQRRDVNVILRRLKILSSPVSVIYKECFCYTHYAFLLYSSVFKEENKITYIFALFNRWSDESIPIKMFYLLTILQYL